MYIPESAPGFSGVSRWTVLYCTSSICPDHIFFKYWVGQKIHLGFPVWCYGKTQVNFLANTIYLIGAGDKVYFTLVFFSLRIFFALLGWTSKSLCQALLPWTAQWELETPVTPVGPFVFISTTYTRNWVWWCWTSLLVQKSHEVSLRRSPSALLTWGHPPFSGPRTRLWTLRAPVSSVAATAPSYMLPTVDKSACAGVFYSSSCRESCLQSLPPPSLLFSNDFL